MTQNNNNPEKGDSAITSTNGSRKGARLSWFLSLVADYFRQPEKLYALNLCRDRGNRIEKWVQVEMGIALQKAHDADSFAYGCWEMEVPGCGKQKCDLYIADGKWTEGQPWPLPPSAGDLWIELKCRTTSDLQGVDGLVNDVRADLGKQAKLKRRQGNVGHFAAVSLVLFGSKFTRGAIEGWKQSLRAGQPGSEPLFQEIGAGNDKLPIAMLVGWGMGKKMAEEEKGDGEKNEGERMERMEDERADWN